MAVDHHGNPTPEILVDVAYDDLTAETVTTPLATVEQLNAVNADITALEADTVTTPALTATAATITDADVTDLAAATADITALTADSITTPSAEITDATVTTLREAVNVVAVSGTSQTVDLANGGLHDITLTANCTLAFAGAEDGKASTFVLILRQDGVGSRTVNWPASVRWPNGIAPTLTTEIEALDILTFVSRDGGNLWYGSWAQSQDNESKPRGCLGYAEVNAVQSGITTEVDLDGLETTVSVGANRRIKISAVVLFNTTVAGDRARLHIKEGTDTFQQSAVILSASGQTSTVCTFTIEEPTEGVHTYKLAAVRATGTGDVAMSANTTFPAFILVEDIGPAT